MAAHLHHRAARHDHDLVGRLYGGQAVRDDQHGAPRHQPRQRALHRGLRHAVQRGGGLIQNDDRAVLEQRARNGDALALAARQQSAALAHNGVVAVRQLRDKLVRVGRLRGRLDLLGRGLAVLAVRDVVGDGAREQDRVLAHHGHRLGPLAARERGRGLAVQEDAARLRLVEARQQRGHRGLARARPPHQRRDGAARQRQRQPRQHGHLWAHGVREVHVAQLQPPAARRLHRGVTRAVRVRLRHGRRAVVGHLPPGARRQRAVHGGVGLRRHQDGADARKRARRAPQLRQRVDGALGGVHE
mmetsp:Transcript_2387/g.6020  ORF Transcript_2387/g.6020 Transcript_2387/m.6020 type:complete len:301 (-) Transcript_2387:1246-2148(-)